MRKIGLMSVVVCINLLLVACLGQATVPTDETPSFSIGMNASNIRGTGTLQDPFKVTVHLLEEVSIPLTITPLQGDYNLAVYQGVMIDHEIHRLIPPSEIDFDFTGTTNSTLVFKAMKLGQLFIVIVIDVNHQTFVEVTVERAPMNINFNERLKVLAIGNSFSVDAMEYLYKIADDAGIDEIVLGNLYIGGASLQTHVSSLQNNTPGYTYYKNTNNQWTSRPGTTLLQGLQDEMWDIITIQQVSGNSGVLSSYNESLETLIAYVETHQTNPHAHIVWHMTWAYQQNASHGDFLKYDRDQLTMYQAIVHAVQSRIVDHKAIQSIIPAGTAIQNLRTSYLGDTLTVDGYHLSHVHGRYTAGLTWFSALTGLSIQEITYKPNGITDHDLDAIKAAVKDAIDHPFAITLSPFTTKDNDHDDLTDPSYHTGGDRLILEFALGFWNSTNAHHLVDGDPISNNFVSTRLRLSKDDIPIGSIIIIEPGYQYRANYWTHLEGPTLGRRSDNMTQSVIIVDEAWWDTQLYVAFNLSVIGTPDIQDRHDEVISKFHIILPYKTLDMTFSSGFYNSTGSHSQVKTDPISPNFISPEVRYSRADLPIGSIITIEEGYQYRANFWMDLTGSFTNNRRTDNITQSVTIIDEAWWGTQQYVTFNVSQIGTPNISNQVELVASKFNVVIPVERIVPLHYTLGFYNSLGAHQIMTGDAISKNFLAVNTRFSRDDLPVGTLLIIQSGYQYRANFWTSLEGGFDNNRRSDNIQTFMIIIDEDWWGGSVLCIL